MARCRSNLSGVVLLCAQFVHASPITHWSFEDLAVYSDGNVTGGRRSSVAGGIAARGSIQLAGEAHVDGDLFAGSSITTGWAATFGESHQRLGDAAFNAMSMQETAFEMSAGNVVSVPDTGTMALDPGSYGALTVGWKGQLVLTAGTYRFDDLALAGEARIALDTTLGDVLVYVASDVELGWRAQAMRSGGSGGALFSVGGDVNILEEGVLDSSLVSEGRVNVGWKSQVAGQLFARSDVNLASQASVAGAALVAVPGPASLAMIAFAALTLPRRRLS